MEIIPELLSNIETKLDKIGDSFDLLKLHSLLLDYWTKIWNRGYDNGI